MRGLRNATALVGPLVAGLVLGSAAGASAADNIPASLTGHGHGTWQVKPSNPDTGTQRLVRGHGRFSIGSAKVRGSVTSPGFIANGDCSVSLRLVTDSGSVKIVGHTKRSTSSHPSCVSEPYRFRFHTAKATGDLAAVNYKGIGHFDLENASGDVTDHGTVTLKLRELA
jgi:hypothetical protein